MDLHLDLLLPAAIGILIQIFVVKIPSLKNRSEAANHPFSVIDYFKKDWVTILGSFLGVLMFLVGWDQIVGLHDSLTKYSKWVFGFVGYTGSSMIQSAFGVTGKLIKQIVDVKTNIADGVVPPVNKENEEGAKEIVEKEHNISPKDL